MSAAAIQQVLTELESLPEADQQIVLHFLRALKSKQPERSASPARGGANPAIRMVDGLLVFTGELEAPEVDWVKVVRNERDETFISQALAQSKRE